LSTKRTKKPGKPLDDALRAVAAGLADSARPSMISGGRAGQQLRASKQEK
jgi:hypothetical protein